tara:strand:- start:192 stop:686 length:495 start_codon:yes stop_codon:yes gene_type:complete
MFPSSLLRVGFLMSLLCGVLMGCSSGQGLAGRVVNAQSPGGRLVKTADNDPLSIPGRRISGATIELIRDPKSMNRRVVARTQSRSDGTFVLDVDAFGAGWMVEEWLFRCSHPRNKTIEFFGEMPSNLSNFLLIFDMTSGAPAPGIDDMDAERERMRRELERYGR